MSKAIKCDRCGKCFVNSDLTGDEYYCHLSDVSFVSFASGRECLIGTIGGDGSFELGRIDLCKNCANKFIEFMGLKDFKDFRKRSDVQPQF